MIAPKFKGLTHEKPILCVDCSDAWEAIQAFLAANLPINSEARQHFAATLLVSAATEVVNTETSGSFGERAKVAMAIVDNYMMRSALKDGAKQREALDARVAAGEDLRVVLADFFEPEDVDEAYRLIKGEGAAEPSWMKGMKFNHEA